MVDVVIPVYRGLSETRRCIESVLHANNTTRSHVVVIDDCSPEPELVSYLKDVSRNSAISLIRNPVNLGFVGTVNHGMAMDSAADVVLLNSDTEVADGWLDRLRRCAYRAHNIGTVTPFSNNATICSYPRICEDNILPEQMDGRELDRLFSAVNKSEAVPLPTAVGFCMYIRRDCLNDVGPFDEERFGRGYGEENDFCLRATAKGWRHLLCCDVFVHHSGSTSFREEKDIRATRALELLLERYPDYSINVARHIKKDPALKYRHRVDLARLATTRLPIVLFVSHRLGGGVVRHEMDLLALFRGDAIFLRLTPKSAGVVELAWWDDREALRLYFRIPDQWPELLDTLREVQIDAVHFQHILDHPPLILELPNILGIPFDVTIHDYYLACPRITLTGRRGQYCGEPNDEGCRRCLRSAPPEHRDIIAWRRLSGEFLSRAHRILCPSLDVRDRIYTYFPSIRPVYAPHPGGLVCTFPPVKPPIAVADQKLRILVLGALSIHKGADLLEAASMDAKRRNLPIEFILIGYGWRKLACAPNIPLIVHGPYRDHDLPELVKRYSPHLAWFPALWPETYSYTLSAAMSEGLPVVAPDLGAFRERLAGRPWSWICHWNKRPTEWNDFFLSIWTNNFLPNVPPPESPARVPVPSPMDWRKEYLPIARHRSSGKCRCQLIGLADGHSRLTLRPYQRVALRITELILAVGVRLRRVAILARLVQSIPITWQSKIRYWLIHRR